MLNRLKERLQPNQAKSEAKPRAPEKEAGPPAHEVLGAKFWETRLMYRIPIEDGSNRADYFMLNDSELAEYKLAAAQPFVTGSRPVKVGDFGFYLVTSGPELHDNVVNYINYMREHTGETAQDTVFKGVFHQWLATEMVGQAVAATVTDHDQLAMGILAKAEMLHPEPVVHHYLRGTLLWKMKQFEAANAEFEKSGAAERSSREYYHFLKLIIQLTEGYKLAAHGYIKTRNFAKAREYLLMCRMLTNQPEFSKMLAQLASLDGVYDHSTSLYKEAGDRFLPTDPVEAAYCYIVAGDEFSKTCCSFDKTGVGCGKFRRLGLGYYNSAITALDKQQTHPLYQTARKKRARSYAQDYSGSDAALTDYQYMRARDPKDVFYTCKVGLALIRRGDYEQASRFIDAVDQSQNRGSVINLPDARWAREYLKAAKEAKVHLDVSSVVSIDDDESGANGTGFVIGNINGRLAVLTNYHVANGSTRTLYIDQNGETVRVDAESKILLQYPSEDIALIGYKTNLPGNKPVTFAKSEARTGEKIFILGHHGKNATSAYYSHYVGRVTAAQEDIFEDNGWKHTSVAFMSPASKGNSGSPIFNVKGEVVGVHTWGGQINELVEQEGHGVRSKTILDFLAQHPEWKTDLQRM